MGRWPGEQSGRFQLATKTGLDAFVNTVARQPLQQLTRAEMSRLGKEELEVK